MATIMNVLRRIFKRSKSVNCHRHVVKIEQRNDVLNAPAKSRWFKKCAFCKCRRVHSNMQRCFRCQKFLHKGCVQTAVDVFTAEEPATVVNAIDDPTPSQRSTIDADESSVNSNISDPADVIALLDIVDTASTSVDIEELATAILNVDMDAATTLTNSTDSAGEIAPLDSVDATSSTDIDESALPASDTVLDTEACTLPCATIEVDEVTVAGDEEDSATAEALAEEKGPLLTCYCETSSVADEGSETITEATHHDLVEEPEVVAGPSHEITAAEDVTPEVVLDVDDANDSNDTYDQWTKRFEQFSKFDEGVMADRESLYSGPPEVLAKQMAGLCKNFRTVMDPFCGAGAIAIQLAMLCPRDLVVAMDKDRLKIKQAKHNARVYGVKKRILFVVGDFLTTPYRPFADVIVTTPPVELCAGAGKSEMAALLRSVKASAPKVLLRLPTYADRTELYSWGTETFCCMKFEEVYVDGVMNCLNVHLGHMKGGTTTHAIHGPMKLDTQIHLQNDELSAERRSEFLNTNSLTSYENYLDKVEDFHQTLYIRD